jgi:hypothetical protein
MESLKHLQFTKKAPGIKWMKKLMQLRRFVNLHFMLHESKVEGACSLVKKMCLQFKLEMDESAIHYFFGPVAASLATIPKGSSIDWRQLYKS